MPEKPARIKKTRWFACLTIWWVLAVFLYLFIASQETHLVDEGTAAGIATVKENTAIAGLPLLERDVQALTQLAQKMSKLEGVVNVAIIDHKNKLITFTNSDQLTPTPSDEVNIKDGVGYWNHTLKDGTQVTCFSGDISFAGTKVGEVLLVMDTGGAASLFAIFFWVALISLVLILFTLLLIDFQGIHPLIASVKERLSIWMGGETVLPAGREVICPLCGSPKPLTRSFLLEANLKRFPVIKPVGNEIGTAQILPSKGVRLSDISHREDLGWLRRQMIHRCLDIIKKLAGD